MKSDKLQSICYQTSIKSTPILTNKADFARTATAQMNDLDDLSMYTQQFAEKVYNFIKDQNKM